MKRLYAILVFIFAAISITSARDHERSVLEIRLNDHSPLVVTVDGRNYDKHGRNITIGNLPRGWHDLKVYQMSPETR